MFIMAVENPSTSLALVMLFMLRDLLVLLWLSCSPGATRPTWPASSISPWSIGRSPAILWISGPAASPAGGGADRDRELRRRFRADRHRARLSRSFLFYARWREITRLKRT